MQQDENRVVFSIIMCTYNSAQTVQRAILSVIKQKFEKWELIILDNGSTDETVDILNEYVRQDTRVRCYFRKNNVGWPKGISICLKYAQGEYTMFLGADDYLTDEKVLETVYCEKVKHNPDIIWTGNYYAVLENGKEYYVASKTPEYKVFEKEDKLIQIYEIMHNVYYNSVMHYVRIDFLKENKIDFFEPYYGDNGGMTEALVKAKKMVVLDKAAYVLTINTSQTSQKTSCDIDISVRWNSVKSALSDARKCDIQKIEYIARRILNNIMEVIEGIISGMPLRDKLMNPVEMDFAHRYCEAEAWISSDTIGELAYFAGREAYGERLLDSLGVLYWECKKYGKIADEIRKYSLWSAEFVELSMERNKEGKIVWKKDIGVEAERIIDLLGSVNNPHRIGCEIMLQEDVIYTDQNSRKTLQKNLNEYLKNWD